MTALIFFSFTQRKKNSDKPCREEEEENRDDDIIEDSYNANSRNDDVLYQIIPRQNQGGIYTWVSTKTYFHEIMHDLSSLISFYIITIFVSSLRHRDLEYISLYSLCAVKGD